jgi:hypothetical protein
VKTTTWAALAVSSLVVLFSLCVLAATLPTRTDTDIEILQRRASELESRVMVLEKRVDALEARR